MKKNIFVLLVLFVCFSISFARTKSKHEITSQRIIDISPFDCDDDCGNLNTYKIINIDTFRALYANRDKRWTKIEFKNLKLSDFREDAVLLKDNDYNRICAVTFDDKNMEELLNHKNSTVNVYGHVREDTRYGWGIIIDVIEFCNN